MRQNCQRFLLTGGCVGGGAGYRSIPFPRQRTPHSDRRGPSLGRSKEKQNPDNVFSSLFSTLGRGTWPAWFCHYKLSCRDVPQQTSLLQADNTLTQPALATASRPGWHKQLCCSTECVGLSRSQIYLGLQFLASFPSLPPGADCCNAHSVLQQWPHCGNIAATRYCSNTAAMQLQLQCCSNIAAMPIARYCCNIAAIGGIAAMPFGIAATPQYFPDGNYSSQRMFAYLYPTNRSYLTRSNLDKVQKRSRDPAFLDPYVSMSWS